MFFIGSSVFCTLDFLYHFTISELLTYLEAFIERKEIAPFYREYLGEKKQPTKAKSGWDIADEILR